MRKACYHQISSQATELCTDVSREGLTSVPESATFHDMRNMAFSGTTSHAELSDSNLVDAVYHMLRARLPRSWQVNLRSFSAPYGRDVGGNFALDITASDSIQVSINVEAKRRIEPKDVTEMTNFFSIARETGALLLVAPFLSPRTKELLVEQGISYADATGNFRLEVSNPALFVTFDGATSNPWSEARPLHSLRGRATGRVVRALSDFIPPYGIRELSERSETSVASVSRVVSFLDREALVVRDGRGAVLDVGWKPLIRRWTDDYSLIGSNRTRSFLAPRGHDALLSKLAKGDLTYAVTGSLAMRIALPVAPARLAVVYVPVIDEAVARLSLREVERGMNVILAEPFDEVVYDRTATIEGVTYAAPSQVAADLLTSPGRGPVEGEALLDWMEANHDAWRH